MEVSDPQTNTVSRPSGLVMAMPRAHLFGVDGFIRQVNPIVIEDLAVRSWFACVDAIRGDVEAKEVRLALIIRRGQEYLVDGEGVMANLLSIPAESTSLAPGLESVRLLAQIAGESILGEKQKSVLIGYLNCDKEPSLRPLLVLVYEIVVPGGALAPEGTSWIALDRLSGLSLDTLSQAIVKGLVRR